MTTLRPLDNQPKANSISLFERYPEKVFDSGENIAQAGVNSPVLLIVEGRVAQYHISSKGDKLSLNIYQADDLLPLPESTIGLPSKFYIEAVSRATVRLIPRSDFHEILRTNPDILYRVLYQFGRDSYNMMLRLAASMEGDAEGRILQELQIVQEKIGGEATEIYITESNLAAQTGLARETVNRALRRLTSRGLVKRPSRGCIELT